MAINTYTNVNNPLFIVHQTSVDFIYRNLMEPIHIVQYDDTLPIIEVKLYKGGTVYTIPNNEFLKANIRLTKPDGTFVHNEALGCNADRNTLYFQVTYQMASVFGCVDPVVEILNTGGIGGVFASGPFRMMIDRNPVGEEAEESTSEWETILETMNLCSIAILRAEQLVHMYGDFVDLPDEVEILTRQVENNTKIINLLLSLFDDKIGYFSSDNVVIDSFENTSHITLVSGVYDAENKRLIS